MFVFLFVCLSVCFLQWSSCTVDTSMITVSSRRSACQTSISFLRLAVHFLLLYLSTRCVIVYWSLVFPCIVACMVSELSSNMLYTVATWWSQQTRVRLDCIYMGVKMAVYQVTTRRLSPPDFLRFVGGLPWTYTVRTLVQRAAFFGATTLRRMHGATINAAVHAWSWWCMTHSQQGNPAPEVITFADTTSCWWSPASWPPAWLPPVIKAPHIAELKS